MLPVWGAFISYMEGLIFRILQYLGVVSLHKLGCILHGVGIKIMAPGYICILC